MHALPLVLSTLAALAAAPSLVAFLTENGHLRTNYAGARIPCPLGLLIPAAAVVALVPLALLYGLLDEYKALDVTGLFLVLGVCVLGLADDAYAGGSRGWRGHAADAAGGGFNTGLLKAVGTLEKLPYLSGEPATPKIFELFSGMDGVDSSD